MKIHITTIEDPFGDLVYLLPTTKQSRVSKAITERLTSSCVWSDTMSAWIIDHNVYDLLTQVIESEFESDNLWCDVCVAWLDDDTSDAICPVFKKMEDIFVEIGCEVCHEGDEDDDEDDEEDEMGNEGPGFKIPDALKKLLSEEVGKLVGVAGNHLKGRGVEILSKQAKAMGIDVPSETLDQLFEAVFVAMRSKVSDRAVTMGAAEAATILGVTLPCTKEAVVAAWRVKARTAHPDAPGGSDKEFVKAGAAREVLMGTL